MTDMATFDTIIVGAGSAGCVLAYRLSEDPAHRVLLIEAGPEDTSPLIPIPIAIGRTLQDPALCWHFMTEPDPGNAGQPRAFMRGRVLGGSSAVNGMVYCRGQPDDYEGWHALGCREWGWQDMARAFRAIENHELGDDGERGVDGPLRISIAKTQTPLTEAVINAGVALGLPYKADINRPQQEGIGYTALTMHRGRRVSAANAFLKPVRDRLNLTVVTDTEVQRILFMHNRATGVSAKRKGIDVEYRASREVIVCCGAIQSPKLLMLSGIGPGDQLRDLGIPVLIDRAAVGQNLREHKTVSQQLRLRRDFSINGQLRGWKLATSAARYALFRSGALASTYDINAFIKTHADLIQPDAQVLFWNMSLNRNSPHIELDREPGLTALGYPLRTNSAGQVRLRSSDPSAAPVITTNFLATEHDRSVTIGIFRWMRALFSQPALAGYIDRETYPGAAIQTDDEILAHARRDETCQHAVGTCRMGADEDAVLDTRLRVRGVGNLRVVDLSAMPTQISGNTNGPVMAFAWRAADLIQAQRDAVHDENVK